MPSTIDQYREAKNQYLKLRNQAKKELIARVQELSNELWRIQRELLEDFGEKVAVPSKPKKMRNQVPAKTTAPASAALAPAADHPKVAAVQKSIERQKKKIADLQAAGRSVKTAQDRLYELEDELRLLKG